MKISTNRGNYLLLKLLTSRFPNIFLSTQTEYVLEKISRAVETGALREREEDTVVLKKIATHIEDTNQTSYPLTIGDQYSEQERTEMADYLLRKHFEDYKSSHCTPLPTDLFRTPWELPTDESDFVFT